MQENGEYYHLKTKSLGMDWFEQMLCRVTMMTWIIIYILAPLSYSAVLISWVIVISHILRNYLLFIAYLLFMQLFMPDNFFVLLSVYLHICLFLSVQILCVSTYLCSLTLGVASGKSACNCSSFSGCTSGQKLTNCLYQ